MIPAGAVIDFEDQELHLDDAAFSLTIEEGAALKNVQFVAMAYNSRLEVSGTLEINKMHDITYTDENGVEQTADMDQSLACLQWGEEDENGNMHYYCSAGTLVVDGGTVTMTGGVYWVGPEAHISVINGGSITAATVFSMVGGDVTVDGEGSVVTAQSVNIDRAADADFYNVPKCAVTESNGGRIVTAK